MRILLISFLFFCLVCLSNEAYNVYDYHNSMNMNKDNIPTVFILDYSNSMNERIDGESKYNILMYSFQTVLSSIPESTPIGVRVYGHRWGITNFDACRASSLVAPLDKYNRTNISNALLRFKPRGMTPITYSLKQTVEKDFPTGNYKKHIVLVTDGGENCDISPCEYAIDLMRKRKDIKIDVIAINVMDSDDVEQLTCTANVTGGKIYNVETSAQLLHSLKNAITTKKEVNAQILVK